MSVSFLDFYASLILSHAFKPYLLVIIAIMAVLIALLFVLLLANILYVERQEKKKAFLEDSYQKDIRLALGDSAYSIQPPASGNGYDVLSTLLMEFVAQDSSPELTRKYQLMGERAGVQSYYRKKARSRIWFRRAEAMEKLGYLRMPQLKGYFISRLKKEANPHVVSKIALALSLISESREDILQINEILRRPRFMSSKFNEFIYANMIHSFKKRGLGDHLVEAMNFLIEDADVPFLLKKDLIEACGLTHFRPALPMIGSVFHAASSEMKITCIRAIGRMGDQNMAPALLKGLADRDWRVRAVAAKSALVCPSSEVIPVLRGLQADENYQVRVNAEITLAHWSGPASPPAH